MTKSSKTTPNASPNTSPTKRERESETENESLAANFLKMFMKTMSTSEQVAEQPNMLVNTEVANLKVFFTETEAYVKAGGKKPIIDFIDKPLLSHLRELELGNSHATQTEVLAHLKAQYQPSGWKAVHDVMTHEVGIDESMTTPHTRLQSLFKSLSFAMDHLGLQETKPSSTCGTDYYPFGRQRKLLLSKLPNDLKVQFYSWQEYNSEAQNRKELWDQLIVVSKGYKGGWGVSTSSKKDSSLRYDEDMNVYAKEHREHFGAARKTRSMDTS